MEVVKKYKRLFNKIYHNLFVESFNKKIDYQTPININRWDLLNKIIDKYNFKDYLEIGCDEDELFSKVNIKNKIGVDPRSGGNVRKTSDDFFNNNEQKFDLIFIDGLHQYHQVKKDINNSIKILNNEGIILLHDCLPNNLYQQIVPRCDYIWNGDVWKAIVEARTWQNVNTYTVLSDQGLGVIKKEKNSNILNIGNLSFKKLKYKFFYDNYSQIMRTKTYEQILEII